MQLNIIVERSQNDEACLALYYLKIKTSPLLSGLSACRNQHSRSAKSCYVTLSRVVSLEESRSKSMITPTRIAEYGEAVFRLQGVKYNVAKRIDTITRIAPLRVMSNRICQVQPEPAGASYSCHRSDIA